MGIKVIAKNRKAYHEYAILETVEAGIALRGTEVKSIRQGKLNFADGWVDADDGRLILRDIHISPYSHGNIHNHEPTRARELLMHHREIVRLTSKIQEKGLTLVPTMVYLKGQWIKLEIGVAKGKKLFDKRESERSKESDRAMTRALRAKAGLD